MRALSLATIGPPLREIQLVAAHDHRSTQKKSKVKKETASHSIGCRKGYIEKVLKGDGRSRRQNEKERTSTAPVLLARLSPRILNAARAKLQNG
jgi:hypothetical protein